MTKETILSPVGRINFLAVKNPVENYAKTGVEYSCSLVFNEADEGVQEYKATIGELNSRKVSTHNVGTGEFKISGSSMYQPTVYGPEGELLTGDNIPIFRGNKGDTGTAVMELSTFETQMGTAFKLEAVWLKSLDLVAGDVEDTGAGSKIAALIAQQNGS
jgi:hypothetical protein